MLADDSRAGGDVQLKYISEMFHYLLHRIEGCEDEKKVEMKANLGTLIPLHCGHNAPYSDSERRMLQFHVSQTMATW